MSSVVDESSSKYPEDRDVASPELPRGDSDATAISGPKRPTETASPSPPRSPAPETRPPSTASLPARDEPPSTGSDPSPSATRSFLQSLEQPQPSSPGADPSVDEHEQTIISQRPVAAPADFYKSMPLGELADMLEGKQLDHFAVEQMIGGGGMGAVFRGRDERLDRTVAIKVIPASKRDPETLRRFRLEAQAAARLDHPNIARVYYVGEAEQWNYIVFEFIDGVNVRDLVGMEGPLGVDDAVYYTRQIAEALQHAHDRKVVHRDIKPSNILVTANGTAKVVDMGLARSTSMDNSAADATASGVTLGTFDYISPEQARDPRDADVRSDLYSLGCSLFFMLTGHPPFPQGTALQKLLNHGSQPPPDPRGWRDDLSDQLYEILMKLMAKQPMHRYQNPAELINDLMLLAEVEDLPRSLSPGTILMTPSVSQRSWLESNLPWLVAFAFLLGSSLWLESVQRISSGFSLPDLQFDSLDARDVVSRSTPEEERQTNEATAVPPPGNIDTGPRLPRQDAVNPDREPAPLREGGPSATGTTGVPITEPVTTEVGPLVVSGIRPADVDAANWTDSLHEAVKRLEFSEGRQEIEVRGRILLDRPLTISRQSIRIRGDLNMRPGIDVAANVLEELDDWSAVIQIDDADVAFSGIDFRAQSSLTGRAHHVGLIRTRGKTSLELTRCLITVEGDSRRSSPICALLGVEPLTQPNDDDTTPSNNEIQLTVDDTICRGETTFLGLRVNPSSFNRLEVSFNNSLLALSGFAVEIVHAPETGSRVSRNVRLFCEQSTFVTRQGFAHLDYVDLSGEPLLSLNRTSNRCLFDSDPTVAHVMLSGLQSESLFGSLGWLLFKGTDNGYDESLSILASCLDEEQFPLAEVSFGEATQDGWFVERGNEQQIRWSHRTALSNLSSVSPAEFQVEESRFFSPGYRAQESRPAF